MQESSPASLKKLAVRGTFWSIASSGSALLIRFGGNVVLTRLLSPEIFGLNAIVRAFINGLEFFSDVGLKPNIVRSKRGEDPVFLNTAWTIQILRGAIISLCSLIIAWPVSRFYNEPSLLWFIPVVGLASLARSFASTSQHVWSKRLDVRKITLIQLSQQILAIVVMICWALIIGPSVWALVIGSCAGNVYYAVATHIIAPKEIPANRLGWEKDAAREIFSFGIWIFLATGLTFLESQSDRLILGKLLTLSELGVYGLALLVSNIPQAIVSKWSGQVLMPVFSRKIDLPRAQLRKQIWKPRLLFTLGIGSLISVMAVFADVFVDWVYDERFQQAGWMLSILAFGIWPRVLTLTINPLLMMMGKSVYHAAGNALKVVYLLILLPLSFYEFGLVGAVVVVAFNDVPYYLVMQFGLLRERMSLLLQDLILTCLITVPFAVMVALRLLLGFGLPFTGIPPLAPGV